jgi:hypothetical protein
MKWPILAGTSVLTGILFAAAVHYSTAADEPSSLTRFGEEARAYEMQIGDKSPSKLELQPKSVLHWANPAENGEDGAVFLWLQHGRPEVIGTFFTYRRAATGEEIFKHSLHSLSSLPITADLAKRRVWAPKTAGVSFQPIPEALPPADSSRGRLLQMKSLAKDFSGKLVDLKETSKSLRLLPQPLVRYEPTAGECVDGAIFALAEGTDPQALVLIEARRTGEAAPTWQFAFARFHFVHLWGYHKDKEVWHVAADASQTKSPLGDPAQAGKIYISLQKK